MSSVRSRNIRRPPGTEPCRPKPEGFWTALPGWGESSPGQPALPPLQKIPAHTSHFGHWADSPVDSSRVHFATLALQHHRPCRMTAESGTPARVKPTRAAWLETALFTAMAVNPHSP